MLLEILFIMKSIFFVVSGQCEGSPRNFNPSASNSSTPVFSIISPHYPNEYNKTSDCEWTISGNGYSYEISFVKKDLHFQDPYGRNYCSGSYVIAFNGEEIDCLWPTDPQMHCFAFHQPSCGGPKMNPTCKSKTNHNGTLRITYISDGRTLGKQNVTGFGMKIKFTKCWSEANSTSGVPTATETHHPTLSHRTSTGANVIGLASTPSPSEGVPTATETHHPTLSHRTSTGANDIGPASTPSPSEASPPPTRDWQIIVIAMGAGFGFLFLVMIALFLFLLHRRSNSSPPENPQPKNPPVAEMQHIYNYPPLEPQLSNRAQYEC